MPETEVPIQYRWLVLYVRPRFEKKVERQVLDAGITCFLPEREEIRIWSDRKKKVIAPLFPGYLFVYVDERRRIEALQAPGALKYVHFGGKISVVPERVIESLRIAVGSGQPLETTAERLPKGSMVKVKLGAASGLRGELVEYRGKTRVVINVEGIRQAVLVEVGAAEIVAVS